MVIAGRIQRYVFREILMGLGLTLGVILLAIVLVDVVEEMRTVGSRTELSLFQAFQLTMLKMPQLILDTLPFAVLVGSMLAYSKLNRSSELSAIRAAGVSAWRFLGPAMVVSVSIGLFVMGVLDPLATRASAAFEERRFVLINGDEAEQKVEGLPSDIWLRQGDETTQSVIHGARAEEGAKALQDVEIFVFERVGQEFEFQRRYDAERALLLPGFWQLEGVSENAPGVAPVQQRYLAIPTTLAPETLLNRYASAKTIPFWQLPKFIRETRMAGLEEDQYLMKFHSLLATPVLLTAMILIGAVVCLRLRRSGGVTQLIAMGTGAGFLLFFINQVAKGLAASGAAPPQAAAWCPPLFALFAVLAVIAFVEDG